MSRPRASAPRVYAHTFRVRIVGGPYAPADAKGVWREIELRGDQTLAKLGEAIPPAFGFYDDHLWSFFLSGKSWDPSTEYTRMPEEHGRLAKRLRVRDAPAGREFLFLFDYGDEWHFGVKLERTAQLEPGASYPRVVARHGEAPPQYPALEDWDDDEEEEEEEDEEEAAFQEERGRLLDRFEAWAGRHGASDDTWLAPMMLDYKWEDAGGELTLWTADDLRDLLLEWWPAMVAVPEEKISRVIPGARAFLLFLEDSGLLDPGGDRHGALDATLDWIAPQFDEVMRDVSRFSPAKAAVSAMQAGGVDLNDEQAVDRFLSDFELPPEVQLSEQGFAEAAVFPPVVLPSLDELQAAAAAAPVVRRLRQLTEWAGEGRTLTAEGNLSEADEKDLAALLGLAVTGLDLMLAWARELRLVRTYKRQLVRIRQQRLLDDPLELFNRAFDALPRLSAELLPGGVVEAAFFSGLPEAIIDLLAMLYVSDEPLPVEQLGDHVWEDHVLEGLGELDVEHIPDQLTDVRRLAVLSETRQLLEHLREMGAVEDAVSGEGQAGLRLTPLGTWRTNVLLRAAGADAPAISDLADAEIEALIDGVAGYDEEACRAELRGWCEARGDDAVRQLAAYARSVPEFERRMMAFTALEEAGPAAEAEVRPMLDDPKLRPLAEMWLVRKGLVDPRSLDPTTATLLMVETLVMFLDADGPASLVEHLEDYGPPDEQIALLEGLWRAPNPRVGEILDAIGKAHPVPKVAKSARKAAFKLRSSGR